MRTKLTAILLLAGTPLFAHRLDEYLQGSIVSIEKNQVQVQMTMTPGVAVLPRLIGLIDTDSNGIISDAEQRGYAERVLGDLSFAIDGKRLTPQLVSVRFPTIAEMEEGLGEIHLDFSAELPSGGRSRRLTLDNHHQSAISVYLVNCLVPRDPDIQIAAQNRNYTQSSYELEYIQNGVGSSAAVVQLSAKSVVWLIPIALLMFLRMAIQLRKTAVPA